MGRDDLTKEVDGLVKDEGLTDQEGLREEVAAEGLVKCRKLRALSRADPIGTDRSVPRPLAQRREHGPARTSVATVISVLSAPLSTVWRRLPSRARVCRYATRSAYGAEPQ